MQIVDAYLGEGKKVQPVILKRELPIEGSYLVSFDGGDLTYFIGETFEENPHGFTQPVYGLFSHRDYKNILISARLMRTNTTKDHLLLNDLSEGQNMEPERNFGYLTFNPKPSDETEVHISDFCLEGALFNSLDHHGERFSCDELRGLVLSLFVNIAKKVYRKSVIRNRYTYEDEVGFYLANGFISHGGPIPSLVKELLP